MLANAHSFKDKSDRLSDVNAGLFIYPVLMAADILLYDAHKVPVGKDQEQHLEMARNFAQRFNFRYGNGETILPEPAAFNYDGGELVKILSLNGEGKMSKSENEMNTLYLADSDEMIRKKIMKAKTDQGPTETNSTKPDYIENLFTLMQLVSKPDTYEKFNHDFNASSSGNCIIRYGDMKKQLAEDMVQFIAPIREKAAEIQHNKQLLHSIIEQGAAKARVSAKATLQDVRTAIGMNYT